MSTWVIRLFLMGVIGLIVWGFGPHIVDNYRAVELGIHGSVAVLDCRSRCHGPFGSDDGSVRIADVGLGSIGAATSARIGESNEAWVAGPGSGTAHLERDWPGAAVGMVFLILLVLFFLMLLFPSRSGRTANQSVLASAAAEAQNLGPAHGGVTWTDNRYLVIGLILVVAGLGPVVTGLTSAADLRLTGSTVGAAVTSIAFLLGGAVLLGKAAAGFGRRLHLFDDGFVVSRRGRARGYRYEDVVGARVSWSRMRDNDPPVPYAIRMSFADGRKITVTERNAVAPIMARVPHD